MTLPRRSFLQGSLAIAGLLWASPRLTGGFRFGPNVYSTAQDFDDAWDVVQPPNGRNNEAGALAWGTSYTLQALLLMYQATQDVTHLSTFVTYADSVLAQTDANRGVSDSAGRSGPVWRSGGNLTVGRAFVNGPSGVPILRIGWAEDDATQATAQISAGSGSQFTLTLTPPASSGKPATVLADVTLNPTDPNYVLKKMLAATTPTNRWWSVRDVRPAPAAQAAPAPTTVALAGTFHPFAGLSGMISYPLAKFARIVGQTPGLHAQFLSKAQSYKAAARAAVDFHAPEWKVRQGTGGAPDTGDYVSLKGSTQKFDGCIQPFNLSHAVGQTLAELYRIDGSAADANKVNAMVYALRAAMLSGGANHTWTYWPKYSELYNGYAPTPGETSVVSEYNPLYTPVKKYEDLGHATITIEMMAAAHRAGLASSVHDITRLRQNYFNAVTNGASDVHAYVGGPKSTDGALTPTATTTSQRWSAGRWATLDEYSTSSMSDHALAVWQAANLQPQPAFEHHLLVIAYRVWKVNSGWLND